MDRLLKAAATQLDVDGWWCRCWGGDTDDDDVGDAMDRMYSPESYSKPDCWEADDVAEKDVTTVR